MPIGSVQNAHVCLFFSPNCIFYDIITIENFQVENLAKSKGGKNAFYNAIYSMHRVGVDSLCFNEHIRKVAIS